jgi:hypothetical protein
MKYQFSKTITVDVMQGSNDEVFDRTYQRGQTIQVSDIEMVSSKFCNITLEDGDLLIDVPKQAITLVKSTPTL